MNTQNVELVGALNARIDAYLDVALAGRAPDSANMERLHRALDDLADLAYADPPGLNSPAETPPLAASDRDRAETSELARAGFAHVAAGRAADSIAMIAYDLLHAKRLADHGHTDEALWRFRHDYWTRWGRRLHNLKRAFRQHAFG